MKIRFLPRPDDRIDATRLSLRIDALSAALADLPAQAHRLARWRAKRDAAAARQAAAAAPGKTPRRHCRLSPLRPGRPPGFSRRLDADMRDLVTDLHGLAVDALQAPDTS